ncbi:uncharacterized protein LOC107364685 [Tetranychus urticae]|uniref:uncharacterized protein LOC107364685 n=1 Tax=Tetranychus urticae TaxID=32264 RepID=UPI000D65AE31|nr:uncharacterized protein LOC107364685 [Tetranychus urticae]
MDYQEILTESVSDEDQRVFLKFCAIEEFQTWKNQIEKETHSFYIKRTMLKDKKIWFTCNRSGNFVSKATGKRHIKIQGSRKTGKNCPSSIFLSELNDGRLSVRFVKTHVGHNQELKHLDIPKEDKIQIASLLSDGIPKQVVLEKIRNTWNEDDSQRVHLTTNKDLVNIANQMGLASNIKRDKNDLVSVESWIEEMHSFDIDPIIIYECDDENKTFMLGISTLAQRYMLEKFGKDIVAIDSTHGTNNYDFQLTTLMVVDENRNGFPVAFFYSSHVDASSCITFFESLKKVCNVQRPNVFMSDDFPGYYNAWVEVFEQPNHHLLCTWHVFRNWNKHLTGIRDLALRQKVKSDIFHLQKVLDNDEFNRLFTFFKTEYVKNDNTKPFVEYIKAYYENRVEQWAACYRKNLGINTNMYLENLHRNLKHIYMGGKKVRRMDESISNIMRLIKNMQFERIIRQEKGYVPKKLTELREKHKIAIESNFQFTCDPDDTSKYTVVSQNGSEFNLYTVEFVNLLNPCSCNLVCEDCKICAHSVNCDCYDSTIKNNLCKHSHFIAMKRNVNEPKESVDNEEMQNLIVEEDLMRNQIEEEKSIFLSQKIDKTPSNFNIQTKKEQFMNAFANILDECVNQKQLAAVEKFLTPMIPTLRAIARGERGASSFDDVSTHKNSQGSGRRAEHQRRFSTKNKSRRTRKKQLRPATIDFDAFVNQMEQE